MMDLAFGSRSGRRWLRRVMMVATVCLAAAPGAFAQREYKTDEIDGSLRRTGSVVKNWVKRPTTAPADVKQFEDYFDKYFFPSMTQASPSALGQIADFRVDLINQYAAKAAPAIQKQITEKGLAFANRIVRGRYHPSVKYNAVLLLGELGSSYTRDGATPLPEANSFLCQISAAASAKRLPPYMQAGALIGLNRHVRFLDQLPAANQRTTVAALERATPADSVPDTVGPLTKDWLRRRAAMGLAVAAKAGNDARLVGVLVAMVNDDALTLDSRAEIAASLEGLPLPADGSAASAVVNLAGEIAKDEANEAEEFEDQQIGGRRSSGSRRGAVAKITSDRYRFDAVDSQITYVREGLVARLDKLQRALKAVSPTAGGQADAVAASLRAVDEVLSTAKNEDSVDLDISASLRTLASSMARLTDPGDAEPAGDDPAEGLF